MRIDSLTGVAKPATPDRFITEKEVGERLHKTGRCIGNWTNRGWLSNLKIGRSRLYSWPVVVAELETRFTVKGGAK